MIFERSVYKILQIVGISLIGKPNSQALFYKSNINNFNEQYDSSKPFFLIFKWTVMNIKLKNRQ